MEGLLQRFSLPHQLLHVTNYVYTIYALMIFVRFARMPGCRLLGDLPLCIILLFFTYPIWCLAVYITNLMIKTCQRPPSSYQRLRRFNQVVLLLWSISSWIWAFFWTYAAFGLLALA